ncbi:MAG: hypothetical protein ACPLRW_06710 [Moorellales bacterium]
MKKLRLKRPVGLKPSGYSAENDSADIPPWADDVYYRYEEWAEFRRKAPDPRVRRRNPEGRFLAYDEFTMDQPTVYYDGEEWDPADLGLEDDEPGGWHIEVIPLSGGAERQVKETESANERERLEELKRWWVERTSRIKSRILVSKFEPAPRLVARAACGSTRVCTACGNTGAQMEPFPREGCVFWLCKSCLLQATMCLNLSEADDTVTWTAKLLALRKPGKAAKAKARFQSLGIDLPWEEVERMAAEFRAMRKGSAKKS